MWIVQTSSGQVSGRARQYGTYRRVCILKLTQHATARDLRPVVMRPGAKHLVALRDMGTHSVGKTDRCAYARAVAAAEKICDDLNNAEIVPLAERVTFGGSA